MVRRARINPFGLNWTRFTVATDSEQTLIGCIQLKPHGAGTAELASLVVAKPWRRKGVASDLIAAVQQQSAGELWLMCEWRLIPFYERFGFELKDDPPEMGAYFRCIWRLAKLARTISFGTLKLAIMRWQQ